MNITILMPRLDTTFKEGPVPTERSSIPSIRQHWANFIEKLKKIHQCDGDQVKVIEKPLWQMTNDFIFQEATQANYIYIPHKQKFEVPVDNGLFYMQTVFPEMFTIDPNGWGAHMSYIPMNIIPEEINSISSNLKLWEELKNRIDANVSKFHQPPSKEKLPFRSKYWLFVCQIPHDQVILQSSKISVIDALHQTLELALKLNKNVLVKGHPINPGAMKDLYELTMRYSGLNAWWTEDLSIHDALRDCEAAFMVNSGVGFEAIIHEKPVVIFGNAEYENVVNKFDGENTQLNRDIYKYQQFTTQFFNHLFYSGDNDGSIFNNFTFRPQLGRN